MLSKQERFVQTEINFVLEKNRGHKPIGLSCMLIAVVRQQDKILAFYKILKLQFSFMASVSLLCQTIFMKAFID